MLYRGIVFIKKADKTETERDINKKHNRTDTYIRRGAEDSKRQEESSTKLYKEFRKITFKVSNNRT